MDYVWRPDLQITNVHSKYKAKSKMMRFYDDGTIEYIELTFARMELLHVRFDAYPFDTHHFEVLIESRSHTDSRIVIETLDDMTGIEVAKAEEWPAWKFDSIDNHVEVHTPDYIHKNPCRTEKRSMYVYVVEATRISGFIKQTFTPAFLLVLTSFVGPFLSLNALMPRIATGFISFLTLSNMMSAQVSLLPKITYDVWFVIFMDTQRYFVFTALIETAFAHVIQDRLSTRTAMKLDYYAQRALPLSYVVLVGYLYIFAPYGETGERAQDELSLMLMVVIGNFVGLFLIGAAWVWFSYRKLLEQLRTKPIEVHRASRVHLDKNELHMLFNFIDVGGGKSLDVCEIVIMMLGLESIANDYQKNNVHHAGNVTISRADCPEQVTEMIDLLEKKFGKVLNKESFSAHHRAIFSEVDIFCTAHPEIDKVWHDHTERVHSAIRRGTLEDDAQKAAPVSPTISPSQAKGEVPVAV